MKLISIQVLYYGPLCESCGTLNQDGDRVTSQDSYEFPAGSTLKTLITGLIYRYPSLDRYRPYLHVTVNRGAATCSTVLAEADTVALIPDPYPPKPRSVPSPTLGRALAAGPGDPRH